MFKLRSSIAFILLVYFNPIGVFGATSEEGHCPAAECFKHYEVTGDDIKHIFEQDDIPEKVLCAIKCSFDNSGIIDADGILDHNKLKKVPLLEGVDDVKIEGIFQCLQNYEKFETCKDIKQIIDCCAAFVKMEELNFS